MTDRSTPSQNADYTPGTGIPIALPLGSPSESTSLQATGQSAELRETNTPRTSSSERSRKRRRLDARALQRLDELLPDRDRLVLHRIAEHRYLTTHQIQHFVFTTHETQQSAARTTRYVVGRLERVGLIRPLARRIGGYRAGSSARVWQLTPGAARLLRDEGVSYRTHDPSPRFLGHCLAIADVHLAVQSLIELGSVVRVSVHTEPDSWRRYAGPGGEPRWLQPDLAAVVSTVDYDDRWFIEVDLGTESLPTLLKKCGQYETYRATGIEQAEHGAFPLVLWLFTKAERAQRLQQAVVRSPRLTPQPYRFAAPDTLVQTLWESR